MFKGEKKECERGKAVGGEQCNPCFEPAPPPLLGIADYAADQGVNLVGPLQKAIEFIVGQVFAGSCCPEPVLGLTIFFFRVIGPTSRKPSQFLILLIKCASQGRLAPRGRKLHISSLHPAESHFAEIEAYGR